MVVGIEDIKQIRRDSKDRTGYNIFKFYCHLLFFKVYIAGDSTEAKDKVSGLVRGAGFVPVDLGAITAARTIEDIPVSVFPAWKIPFIINIILFVFLYALSFAKFQVNLVIMWPGFRSVRGRLSVWVRFQDQAQVQSSPSSPGL